MPLSQGRLSTSIGFVNFLYVKGRINSYRWDTGEKTYDLAIRILPVNPRSILPAREYRS
jgi:hypothetical protein